LPDNEGCHEEDGELRLVRGYINVMIKFREIGDQSNKKKLSHYKSIVACYS